MPKTPIVKPSPSHKIPSVKSITTTPSVKNPAKIHVKTLGPTQKIAKLQKLLERKNTIEREIKEIDKDIKQLYDTLLK